MKTKNSTFPAQNKTFREMIAEVERINNSFMALASKLPPINIYAFALNGKNDFVFATPCGIVDIPRNLYTVKQKLLHFFKDDEARVEAILNAKCLHEQYIPQDQSYIYVGEYRIPGTDVKASVAFKFWTFR